MIPLFCGGYSVLLRKISRLMPLFAVAAGVVWVASFTSNHGVILMAKSVSAAEGPTKAEMKVERTDPGLDLIVPAQPVLQKVATGDGFKWTEGPVWIPTGYLLFAEIPS